MSRQAGRFITTLPPRQYKQIVGTVLALAKNPKPDDSRPLKGSGDGNRHVDVGGHRMVYRVEDEDLLVLVAGKRIDSDAYQWLDLR